jgi:hypothetical protein
LHPGATLRAYPKHGGDNQLFEIVTLKRWIEKLWSRSLLMMSIN